MSKKNIDYGKIDKKPENVAGFPLHVCRRYNIYYFFFHPKLHLKVLGIR